MAKLSRAIVLSDVKISEIVTYLKEAWVYLEKDKKLAKELAEAVTVAFIKALGKIPRGVDGITFKKKEDLSNYIRIGVMLAEVLSQGTFLK